VEISIVDPLSDARWDQLVAQHPRASVFHERGWLEALTRTYGYKSYVLTSAPFGQPLDNAIVLCRVSSWLTGTRLVSLPFSDHCEPLLSEDADLEEFLKPMCAGRSRRWGYVEFRPLFSTYSAKNGLRPSSSYWFHELDLTPGLDEIFGKLHKNSFQRKIQRAEREGLSYEQGRSEHLIGEFYGLLLRTRRRHQTLPQPRAWFKNLCECLGKALLIRVARKNGFPIAAMLTLRHRQTVVYKYGCSDEKFHSAGGMPFLFWRLIEESKASGAQKIDLGRTDTDNEGLITFKDRLGAGRRMLTYVRYSKGSRRVAAPIRGARMARRIVSFLPESVSCAAGRLLYRHLG
jgi:CelD/BcsL family acetyltransferase involved in cellulose biosynthesis